MGNLSIGNLSRYTLMVICKYVVVLKCSAYTYILLILLSNSSLYGLIKSTVETISSNLEAKIHVLDEFGLLLFLYPGSWRII